MKRTRKKTGLPRVTVLSMSRKELVQFSVAVESVCHAAGYLGEIVERLVALEASMYAKVKRSKPSPASADESKKSNEGATNGQA